MGRTFVVRAFWSCLILCGMAATASAQVRYANGRAYSNVPYNNGYYGNNYYGGGYVNNAYSGNQMGYGAAGAWNALSRRHGYDPVYTVQPQPVIVQQPYYQPQPTLYIGGTGYQYAPTVSGQPGAIFRGY